MQIETIKVKSEQSKSGYAVINKQDFDSAIHEVYGAKKSVKPKAVKAEAKPKSVKAAKAAK